MAKQVKKWITINGNHVPVYEDGSMGGIGAKLQMIDELGFEEDQFKSGKSNQGDIDLSNKKPGAQMTIDYNDLDETPEEFKERAEKEGFEIIGEGGHSVSLRKKEEEELPFQSKGMSKEEKAEDWAKETQKDIAAKKANIKEMGYAEAGQFISDHKEEFGLSDDDDAYQIAAQIKNGDIKLDQDGKVSKADRDKVTEGLKAMDKAAKERGDYIYIEDEPANGKKLEDHSDIQKIAEEHVKKIWNGGAANRELYDAADKWAEEHNFDKNKARDAAFAAMSKKQMAEIAKREKAKGFSAEAAAKDINAISMSHNNRGGDTENDWKKVRDTLEAAPVGTVMIETGDRGAKFQYVKNEDGTWHTEGAGGYDATSKNISMSWVGQGSRPEVEFTTPDKALSNQQIKDTQTAAVNGKLNQQLGLDKNGRKIGNRSTPKVDVPEKSIKIGDKQVGVSKDPHAAEKVASAKKMVANNESNLAGLREQLKKHPNDEHTAEIKAAIKKAEGRVKDSKNTLAEREGKSINVGGKKIGVSKGRTPSIKEQMKEQIVKDNLSGMSLPILKDIATGASFGMSKKEVANMSADDLRKKLLAIWQKKYK